MGIEIFSYLKKANVQESTAHYFWDDWKSIPAIEEPNEDLVTSLARLSQRSILAFECATAEWIIYRFGVLDNDPAPWEFLEAAWAMTISPRYSGYGKGSGWQSYSQRGWDGPVRRPIKNGLDGLEIDIRQLTSEYHTDPSFGAAVTVGLATYVMTDPMPFNKWRDQVLARLEGLFPRDPKDPLGDPVPRQALDLDSEFLKGDSERLLNKFLAGLDYRRNPFLSSPEGMLEHFDAEPDFIGRPYEFDMGLDQLTRRASRAM